MHTNIRIQRYTYINAYVHEFIHKNKPPHYHIDHRQRGNDINSFIQSGYFFSAPLCPLLLGGAPDHSNCMTVSEFTRRSAISATVYSRGLQTTGRGPDSARQGLQSG